MLLRQGEAQVCVAGRGPGVGRVSGWCPWWWLGPDGLEEAGGCWSASLDVWCKVRKPFHPAWWPAQGLPMQWEKPNITGVVHATTGLLPSVTLSETSHQDPVHVCVSLQAAWISPCLGSHDQLYWSVLLCFKTLFHPHVLQAKNIPLPPSGGIERRGENVVNISSTLQVSFTFLFPPQMVYIYSYKYSQLNSGCFQPVFSTEVDRFYFRAEEMFACLKSPSFSNFTSWSNKIDYLFLQTFPCLRPSGTVSTITLLSYCFSATCSAQLECTRQRMREGILGYFLIFFFYCFILQVWKYSWKQKKLGWKGSLAVTRSNPSAKLG